MISPPIVCSNVNCKKVFFSNDILCEPGASLIIQNSQVGSCPKCGAPGYVPNGSYSFFNDFIEVVIAPDTTIAQLQEFLKIFKDIERNSNSPELTARAIEEKVSNSPLKAILPQNRQEVIQYAGVIVAVLAALITLKGPEEKGVNIQNKTEVTNYIQIIIQNYGSNK